MMTDDQINSEHEEEESIQVDIDEETSQGIYSNLVISNYSKEEFVVDFVFLQPQLPKGKIRSRVILSPKNAKRLAILLQNNVEEYEENFGLISDDPGNPGVHFSIN